MAWSVTELTAGQSAVDADHFDTASITVAVGDLVVVTESNTIASGAATAISSITGLTGGTGFSSIVSGAGITNFRVSIWAAISGTAESHTLTINHNSVSQDGACWSVFKVTGGDVSSTVANARVQATTGSGSSAASPHQVSTFGAGTDAGNLIIAAFIASSTSIYTPMSGWTGGTQNKYTSSKNNLFRAEYLAGAQNTPEMTIGASASFCGVAVEFKAAPAGTILSPAGIVHNGGLGTQLGKRQVF